MMSRYSISADTRLALSAVSRLKERTDQVLEDLIKLQGSPLLLSGTGMDGAEGDDAVRQLYKLWLPLLTQFAAVADGFQALGEELLAVQTAKPLMHMVAQPARLGIDPMPELSSRGLPEFEKEGEEAKEDFAQSGLWTSLGKEDLIKQCERYNEEVQNLLDIVQVAGRVKESKGPSSPSFDRHQTGRSAEELARPSSPVLGKRLGPSEKSGRAELEALVESMTKGKRLKSNKEIQ